MNLSKSAKAGFSLIELMIVVVILGALTAILIPQFSNVETDAKDTGCDASNYATLRQLNSFQSLNSVYPAGLHTGLGLSTAEDLMGFGTAGAEKGAKIPSFTAINLGEGKDKADKVSTTQVKLTAEQAESLRAAGMINLAYGGFSQDAADPLKMEKVKVAADSGYVNSITGNWYEAWETDATGKATDKLDTASAPISINGIPLYAYQYANADDMTLDATAADTGWGDKNGIVVPLFAAPTVDWEHYYIDGVPNASKVGVAQEGACPWLEGGAEFRYYMCIFKVFNDGTPAKLLGTVCPEGGSLNP